MIPAAELAALQAVAGASLPDRCTIRRATIVDGRTEWAIRAADVACRLGPDPRPPRELDSAGPGILAAWRISLPAGTAVAIADRITLGARHFAALAVESRSWEISRVVRAQELFE